MTRKNKTGSLKKSLLPLLIAVFAVQTIIGLLLGGPPSALAAAGLDRRLSISPDKLRYPALHFLPPKAERTILQNGLIVYILEDHELPVVHLSLMVRTGSVFDPKGKEGLAEIAAKVMRSGGAGKMSGQEIDDTLEFMAASIESAASTEHTRWTMDVLKKDVGRGMNILAQILQAPLFDTHRFKLAQDLKMEEIRRIYDEPQQLAFREFSRLLYRNDPRGRLPSLNSVKTISVEDIVAFHKAYYFPGNMILAVSGDIAKAEAVRLIHDHLGSWAQRGPAVSIPKPLSGHSGHMRYIVKDTPQSVIVAGQFAPSKNSRAYHAFDTLDFLIGSGGFRSRIFQEIRTNRGLAYSAGSFYRARSEYGVFAAYAMTKTESAPVVLSLIQSILQNAKTASPAEKELSWAKKSMINRFIFEYQSSNQIAAQQMMNEYNKLPADFWLTYCAKIDKLTLQDLLAAGHDYLLPDDMSVLILGSEDGYGPLKKRYPILEKKKAEHD